jgi:hypothetical protein
MYCKPTVALLIAVFGAKANAQTFNLTIDPAKTYTDGSAVFRLYSHGTLVGNYQSLGNPGGTRTKPGLLGSFDLTENVPVAIQPFIQFGGNKKLNTSGGFALVLDLPNNKVRLMGYDVNRLANGPLPLGATIALNNEAFRTRNPTLVVPDHLPAVRMGAVTVDTLRVHQKALSNNGLLVPLGGGRYRLVVTFMADVQMNVSQFGQTQPVVFSVPYSLVGTLTVTAGRATLAYGPGQGGENVTIDLNYPLDPFALQLQVAPGTAPGFVFDLTLHRISLAVNGIRAFFAASP